MSNRTGIVERFKRKAARLKQEVYALYLAYKDPRVSWYARVAASCDFARGVRHLAVWFGRALKNGIDEYGCMDLQKLF
jgi:hypothetical protein